MMKVLLKTYPACLQQLNAVHHMLLAEHLFAPDGSHGLAFFARNLSDLPQRSLQLLKGMGYDPEVYHSQHGLGWVQALNQGQISISDHADLHFSSRFEQLCCSFSDAWAPVFARALTSLDTTLVRPRREAPAKQGDVSRGPQQQLGRVGERGVGGANPRNLNPKSTSNDED
eukprot:scaffold97932_cov19-Tisochrysis_lutea.AAC.1